MPSLQAGINSLCNVSLKNSPLSTSRCLLADILRFYSDDASKRDEEKKLKIKRIYEMLPSVMQQAKKRIVVKDIENTKGKRYSNYIDEFDYLLNSGIANGVKAIANPVFPLRQSVDKNLIKLYMNDEGLLSCLLFHYDNKKNGEVDFLVDDYSSLGIAFGD